MWLAVVMCPNRKWKFFEKVQWKPHWIRDAQKKVQNGVWKKYYKPKDVASTPADLNSASQKKKNLLTDWEERTLDTEVLLDEYEQYCKAPVITINKEETEKFNPREWWLEPTQQRLYPNLSKMALDLLSCPAMSAEVERLFSNCKITITDRRSALGIDSVEAIECLKSWMRVDNISWIDSDLDTALQREGQNQEG
jgi:hypothetical protein